MWGSYSVLRISGEESIASKFFGIQDSSIREDDYISCNRCYSTHRTIDHGTEYHPSRRISNSRRLKTAGLAYPNSRINYLILPVSWPNKQIRFLTKPYISMMLYVFVRTDGYQIYFVARDDCFALIRRQFHDTPNILVGGTSQILISLAWVFWVHGVISSLY